MPMDANKQAASIIAQLDKRALHKLVSDVFGKEVSRIGQTQVVKLQDSTQDFLMKLTNTVKTSLSDEIKVWAAEQEGVPVLPDGIKYYHKSMDINYLFIEEKPQVRTLLIIPSLFDGFPNRGDQGYKSKSMPVRIALPYVVFCISAYENFDLESFHVFFRNESLKTLNDQLYCAALPNVHDIEHKVCMGQVRLGAKKNLTDLILSCQTAFWTSQFNADYTGNMRNAAKLNKSIKTIETWQKNTVKNPAFILKCKWVPAFGGITKFIEKIDDDGGCENSCRFQSLINDVTGKATTHLFKSFNEAKVESDFYDATKKVADGIVALLTPALIRAFGEPSIPAPNNSDVDDVIEEIKKRLAKRVIADWQAQYKYTW